MGRKSSEFYTQRKISKELSEIKMLSDKWKLRKLELAGLQDKKILKAFLRLMRELHQNENLNLHKGGKIRARSSDIWMI